MDVSVFVRRHGDVVIAVTLAVLYTSEIARWESADLSRAVPCGLVAALTLALRRKQPLVTFVLVTAANVGALVFAEGIDGNSIAFLLIFFLSLYSLGRHARGTEAWLASVAVLVTIVLFVIGDGAHAPSDIAFATGFVGTPWAAGLAIRLRRDRELALAEENRQLEEDQEERARQAVIEERARIARELHDVVSHAISVSVLQARGGRKMIGLDDGEVRRALDAIEHTNTQALGDMRRLLSLLRDTEDGAQTDPAPSLARLGSLVDQLRTSGLPVELEVTGQVAPVPPGVDLSAYRIIQEALTNVLKHAGPAAQARVNVVYGTEELDISVADDGVTGTNGDHRGHGLIGIRERVAVVGGEVEAGPDERGGFVVRAHLPYTVEG